MTLNINQWTNGCRTVARTPPVGRASLADERDASPGILRQLAVMHRHHGRWWWCWWYCMSTDSLRLRLTPPAAPLNHKAIITPPPVGNAALWWACLSVCLSVCKHISRITRPAFTKFSTHVACGHGSVILRWRRDMLCISGFLDDVKFCCNGLYWPCLSSCSDFAARHVQANAPTAWCWWRPVVDDGMRSD